jgi:ubiquinone/menaquinone biosynthesis C-methylase UbiE
MKSFMAPAYWLLEHAHGYALSQRLAKPTTDRFRGLIAKYVSPAPDAKLLDIGCGTGNYRSSFVCDYWGVDNNPAYIDMANAGQTGHFAVMDATRLDFADSSFDQIITIATLHHLDDDQVVQMVQETTRVCRPSGRVHLLDAIMPVSPVFAFKRLWFRLDRGGYPRSIEHLRGLVEKAGRIIKVEIVNGPLHDVAYIAVEPAT